MEHTPNKNFEDLKKISKTATTLDAISALLEWDQETYMPKDSIHYRSEQVELIASLSHKAKISKEFSQALEKLIDIESGEIKDTTLNSKEKAAAREWRRDYLKSSKLPTEFVEEFARTTSMSMHVWSEAKKHGDFATFSPHLKKIVELNKKKAELLGYEKHPYDALLDLYEPGMTTEIISPLFAELKLALTDMLRKIQSKSKHSRECLKNEFSAHHQLHFSKMILKEMGFHENYSRLDLSEHPFCSSLNPKDIRMTTRVIPGMPLSCIFSVIHEAGHGIYESQLDESMHGTPLCSAMSLGIHESQSRLWETIIGKSYSFWQHFFPILQKESINSFKSVQLDEFFFALNHVEPSLIRVEADEVTYCLHVIIRYEIEKGLIEGSLQVEDLPKIWNRKITETLGITPNSDREGCLQDIHWSMGAFGYFPTYALGNIYAAQIFEVFEKQHPDWKHKVASGNLLFIRQWLEKNLHKYGREFTPEEIIHKITNRGIDVMPYINYLNLKFSKIYNYA
ncbi:MAG: carboxypeptidase M32 [Chlamydiae bacterium]|nr:carboxypeptidase M32 [Chlamydiota bacterium]